MPRKNKKLPRHLLVIRTSAMGDVAMLPHALRALKEAYPEVKVTVATKSLFHPFFEGVDVDFLDIETRRTHRGSTRWPTCTMYCVRRWCVRHSTCGGFPFR